MKRAALPLLDHIIWLYAFIYFLKECRDIYCRKEAFQWFEGMAEECEWELVRRPGSMRVFFASQDAKGYTETNILLED